MTANIAGRELIPHHLEHGDYWPDGHRLAGQPTGPQTPARIIVHAMGYRILTENGALYAASYLDSIGLSAHVLVAPGGALIRCREDIEVAWHARGFNWNSLGVEVLVDGDHNYGTFLDAIDTPWVNDRQFDATVDLVRHWCRQWGIEPVPGQLDRHSDVDPDRKHDPGNGFPWVELVNRLNRRA